MPESLRSDSMRLPVSVRIDQEQPPPWQDLWKITGDGAWLTQLSAELLSLPDPLPPRLHQLRRLTESVVARGLEHRPRPADWEHGSHPATLAVDKVPEWDINEHGARVLRRDTEEKT